MYRPPVFQQSVYLELFIFYDGYLPNFCQCFLKLNGKQNAGKGDSDHICNGLCHIDAGGGVVYHMRHQVDERKQQDKFPDDGHNDGVDFFSKRGKGHLAGNLNTEQEETSQIDSTHWSSKVDKTRICRKNTYEYSWNKLYSSPK